MLTIKPIHLFNRSYPSCRIYTSSTFNYIDSHLNSFLSSKNNPTTTTNSPPTTTFQSLLQSHAIIITTGNSNNVFIASKLISFYDSFTKPHLSTKVFNSVNQKDTFLWNSIVKSQFSAGNYSESIDFYSSMTSSGTLPNHFTIPIAVSACAELFRLDYGRCIHGLGLKCDIFGDNSAVGSSFVYMYAKCGLMVDAYNMFDEIPVRDVVAWTALINGYVQNGENEKGLECFRDMVRVDRTENQRPNHRTLEGGLSACGNLGSLVEGVCLHGFVVKIGVGCSQIVQSSLLSMYSKFRNIDDAIFAFHEVVDKDIRSWTSIISVYARIGLMKECSSMFRQMQIDGIYPDGIIISCMFSGYGNAGKISEGMGFHGLSVRRNYLLDLMVQNSLLSMYCKFGLISIAEKLFDRMKHDNKEAWNIMLTGYGKIGFEEKCIEMFRQMQCLHIETESTGFVSMIASCSRLGATTRLCKSVHCYVVKQYMDDHISVVNSLVNMYGKKGNLTVARRMFRRVKQDVITWNTMMSSYIRHGKSDEAIAIFDKMMLENVKPNTATLLTVLSACSHVASLEKGEEVRRCIEEKGYELNLPIVTALIDMYGKCGRVEKSRELFNSTIEKDVVCWNVMISIYGLHGDARSSIELFHEMEKTNLEPNKVTFLAVLSACTHSGLVEEGKYIFDKMRSHSVEPGLKHYACVVDLLARSGHLQDAESLVLSMPVSPDAALWGTLLSSCATHNETEMGVRMAKRAIETDPENDGYYIMLANMYTCMGRWADAEVARKTMKEKGVDKRAGLSAV